MKTDCFRQSLTVIGSLLLFAGAASAGSDAVSSQSQSPSATTADFRQFKEAKLMAAIAVVRELRKRDKVGGLPSSQFMQLKFIWLKRKLDTEVALAKSKEERIKLIDAYRQSIPREADRMLRRKSLAFPGRFVLDLPAYFVKEAEYELAIARAGDKGNDAREVRQHCEEMLSLTKQTLKNIKALENTGEPMSEQFVELKCTWMRFQLRAEIALSNSSDEKLRHLTAYRNALDKEHNRLLRRLGFDINTSTILFAKFLLADAECLLANAMQKQSGEVKPELRKHVEEKLTIAKEELRIIKRTGSRGLNSDGISSRYTYLKRRLIAELELANSRQLRIKSLSKYRDAIKEGHATVKEKLGSDATLFEMSAMDYQLADAEYRLAKEKAR